MIRTYSFFDMETVQFDDELPVKDLMKHIFDESDYYEPAGMDIATALDAHYAHIVTDTSKKCKDELLSERDFCVAYYVPDKFYFAEGGWGHHMREMDAINNISNPVDVQFRFKDFKHTVVLNGKITLKEIYAFLVKSTYIDKQQQLFRFCEMDRGMPDFQTEKEFSLSENCDLTINKACEGYIEPICFITQK